MSSASALTKALGIGQALAAIKDTDALLEHILTQARDIIGAEGASIYTLDADDHVVFRAWQNTVSGNKVFFSRAPVSPFSLANYVVRNNVTLNVDDVYTIPEDAPYRFEDTWDRKSGYRTRSVLTVSMSDKKGHTLGALQLINCLEVQNGVDQVIAFDDEKVAIVQSLAGQAGIALENQQLYLEIENLLEGMIVASITAIESRDPTTAGHSARVADFCLQLAQAVSEATTPAFAAYQFNDQKLKELRYAALLHDFGKVGVREHVLVKAEKLYPRQYEVIQLRFALAKEAYVRKAYRSLLDTAVAKEWDTATLKTNQMRIENEIVAELARLDAYFDVVNTAKQATVLTESVSATLHELMTYPVQLLSGEALTLIDTYAFDSLSVTKGSLREDERREIESHVTHTYKFLKQIPWGRELKNVAHIAYAHHEKLDGTGYPRGLRADEIPLQSQIMAVCDIFDALSAWDRPYKKAVPEAKALDILRMEARAGKVNADLVDMFCHLRTQLPTP